MLLVVAIVGLFVRNPVQAQICPPAPTLTGSVNCSGHAQLSWSSDPAAVSYQVFRSTSIGSGVIASINAPSTSYVDTTVPIGEPVSYRVRAITNPTFLCLSGLGAYSDWLNLPPFYPEPDFPVANFVASPTCSGVSLSWTAHPQASSYRIRITRDAVVLADFVQAATTYIFSMATSALPAVFTVIPVDACGREGPPNTQVAQALGPPGSVANLTATSQCEAVLFSWSPGPNTTQYRVRFRRSGGPYSAPQIITQTSLTVDATFGFVTLEIEALNTCFPSGPIALISGNPIQRVQFRPVVSVEAGPCGTARVSWFPVPHATGHTVRRIVNGTVTTLAVGAAGSTYVDCDAPIGSAAGSVVWEVAGVNECGTGPFQSTGSQTLPLPDVAVLSSTPIARVQVGQTASMSVNVQSNTAQPVTYQWRRNGQNLADSSRISGVTTSTLTVSAATVADTDAYEVLVTQGASLPIALPAMLIVTKPCPADFNDSGSPNLQDIFDFLNAWFAGCP